MLERATIACSFLRFSLETYGPLNTMSAAVRASEPRVFPPSTHPDPGRLSSVITPVFMQRWPWRVSSRILVFLG